MVNLKPEYSSGCTADVQEEIKAVLEKVQAMRAEDVARRLRLDISTVRQYMEDLVAQSDVEVLRPRFNPDRAEFFRLIRDTDDDYVWEQEVTVRVPAGWFLDVAEAEQRR